MPELPPQFDLRRRVAVVTGAAGLLGREHALALLEVGAAVALLDVDPERLTERQRELSTSGDVAAFACDITDADAVAAVRDQVVDRFGRVDVLVNNAANNPAVDSSGSVALSRLEHFPIDQWNADMAVGLTGAFLCAREFGGWMADHDGGAILNIASDLAVIAPDQRLYRQEGVPDDQQPAKPVELLRRQDRACSD